MMFHEVVTQSPRRQLMFWRNDYVLHLPLPYIHYGFIRLAFGQNWRLDDITMGSHPQERSKACLPNLYGGREPCMPWNHDVSQTKLLIRFWGQRFNNELHGYHHHPFFKYLRSQDSFPKGQVLPILRYWETLSVREVVEIWKYLGIEEQDHIYC